MSNNDYLINTDQGKIGPVKSGRFKFDQVVGIGGRDKMTNNASEQIRVVKFLYTKPGGETKESYIIGKIIKKGDIINLIDGDRTLTPTITDFENTTWSKEGNSYNIITNKGKIGNLQSPTVKFTFDNVVGIGSREIMLAPAAAAAAAVAAARPSAAAAVAGRSWGSKGAPLITIAAAADVAAAAPAAAAAAAPAAPAAVRAPVSWGSPGAPKIIIDHAPAAAPAAAAAPACASWGSKNASKIGGKKTRRRRINRRRKSQKKVNSIK